jgi:hypothetical protein
MTVTGTLGGFCFAAWAGADHLRSALIRKRATRRSRARPTNTSPSAIVPE